MDFAAGTATIAAEPRDDRDQVPANHPGYSSSIRLAVWVFAAFQFFFMLTSTGRVRTADEYNTLYTAESLVLRGSTAVPQAVQLHNFYGRRDLYGQPQAAYPPGQAVLCMPWFAFGQYVLSRLPGVPAEDTDLVVGFSSCLSSATFSALVVAFFFLLLTDVGVSVRASVFAVALLGLATPIFAYSGWLFSEPLSAATFMAAAWIIFRQPGNAVGYRAAAIAGLILGLGTWVRPTNVLAIAIFVVAVLLRDGKAGWRAAAVLCTASAVGVLALLFRDARLFGRPFDFGYPTTAGGVKIENRFDTPLATGLYGLLLSPGKSMLLFAPPVILAVVGMRRLWKLERGLATLALGFPAVYLLFYARYAYWEGGYCVGPRYLVPAVAMLCLGLGAILASDTARARYAAIVSLAVGAVVQCISLATSFMEDQTPARGHYYDAHWHYRLSYSLSGQVQLLWKYLREGQPPTLGLGWDRWFVFLHNGGISALTLACLAALMILGLAISIVGVVRILRSASRAI
jgi:hypothetical protein